MRWVVSAVNLLLQTATYISSWGDCVVSYEDKQAVPVPLPIIETVTMLKIGKHPQMLSLYF